jgi:hypothetical protein
MRREFQASGWSELVVCGAFLVTPCTVKDETNDETKDKKDAATSSSESQADAAALDASIEPSDTSEPKDAAALDADSGVSDAGIGETSDAEMLDGSASVAASCGDVTEIGVCVGAELRFCENGELLTIDCGAVGGVCEVGDAGAQCVETSRAGSCGEVTTLGTCEGAVMRFCDETGVIATLREVNCAAYGQLCDAHAADDGGALCVAHGACPSGVNEEGECSENRLRFCEVNASGDNELFEFECGLDECRVVEGFADCFATAITNGCDGETPEGRCDQGKAKWCLGGVATTEDCAAIGLSCVEGDDGASCQRGECPSTCPTGYSCEDGLCTFDGNAVAEWTIALYIVGDNNLSDNYWYDLKELESVAADESVNVVVQAEFSPLYSRHVPEVYRTGAFRGLVQKQDDFSRSGTFENGEVDVGGINMSTPEALGDFLKWAAEKYPAKRTMLIMSDHGNGYLGGFQDSTSSGHMHLQDIPAGISRSGVHLDVIAFDACLMGMHEVGMALRGVADVMVASQEAEPATGYDYDGILNGLHEDPTSSPFEVGALIGSTFAASNADASRIRGVTTSTVDLSKLPAFNEQLANLAQSAIRDQSLDRARVRGAVDNSEIIRFMDRSSADLNSALNVFAALDGSEVAGPANDLTAWLENNEVIRSNYATGDLSAVGGLAVFLPQLSNYMAGSTVNLYTTETAFLPLQPWHALARSLVTDDPPPVQPGQGAVDGFSAVLTWGSTPTNSESGADLDIYVYEPGGDFGTPANGTTSGNGFLSGDSYDTELAMESYELQPIHAAGTYIVLVHLYDIPKGEKAYPRLQIYRDDLPGGSRTLLRAKVEDRKLIEVPMDLSKELTTTISADNIQDVFDLEYSNLWYATTIEVVEHVEE